MHPMMVYSITAKALIGVKPPISIPQNNRGSVASASADRLQEIVLGTIALKHCCKTA